MVCTGLAVNWANVCLRAGCMLSFLWHILLLQEQLHSYLLCLIQDNGDKADSGDERDGIGEVMSWIRMMLLVLVWA